MKIATMADAINSLTTSISARSVLRSSPPLGAVVLTFFFFSSEGPFPFRRCADPDATQSGSLRRV